MAPSATPFEAIPLPELDNTIKKIHLNVASLDSLDSHNTSITISEKKNALAKEDFHRWRPKYHLMPYRNWANDPCGPCYSVLDGGYYHMAFQWNPYGSVWGNMSWGHALSRDLVHWQVSSQPSIQPSDREDPCGVFTGCTWPTNPHGISDTTLTSFYTSAQHTPIHWTLPYQKGSELVRMATSEDCGRTWKRYPVSSLLPGPPEGVDVTGWRDPYIGPWESIDKCLGRKTGEYIYGVIAGGIRDCSPTIFLYSIDAHNLTQWSFLCMLIVPGINFSPSPRLPDFGTNWEVTNFMTLRDNLGDYYDVLIMGVEGGCARPNISFPRSKVVRDRPTKTRRSDHSQNWLCGQVNGQRREASGKNLLPVTLQFRFGGCLDFGCFYAANSFHDPLTGKQIVHGWVTEEDLPTHLVEKQNWSGLLSLPRIICMRSIQNVVASSCSDLETLNWIHCSPSSDGTYTVTTLTSSCDPRLSSLRRNERRLASLPVNLDDTLGVESPINQKHMLSFDAKNLEIQATFSVSEDSAQIGLELYLTPNHLCKVTIAFDPREEYIIIERHNVRADTGGDEAYMDINDDPEVAPHTLFSIRDPSTNTVKQETLDIHLFFDVSVLEVFINERVAITTRIYPESGRCFGVRPFVKYTTCRTGGEKAVVLDCIGWELQPSVTWEE